VTTAEKKGAGDFAVELNKSGIIMGILSLVLQAASRTHGPGGCGVPRLFVHAMEHHVYSSENNSNRVPDEV